MNPYENGPLGRGVQTENVFLADADSSNGTIDYFKFDPDGDTALQTPHITFDIEDADPHNYCVIIRFRQTVGEGTWDWNTGGWSSMRVDLGANMSADINLTTPDYQGKCLNANDNDWGTYTYDLIVLEYEGASPVWTQGAAMDWNFVKRYKDGYHLWVPEDLPAPNGDDDGHDVWAHVPEDGAAELRGYYCLESDYGNDAVQRGNDVQIQVVDSELSERGSAASGPVAVGLIGADYGTVDADENDEWDGLSLYTYQDNDPAGTWRAIFMASDNGGVGSPEWRTHTPLRMLTANQAAGIPKFYLRIDDGPNSFSLRSANINWNYVESAMKLAVPYDAKWCVLKRPISVKMVDGGYLPATWLAKATFHVTTLFNTDEALAARIPGYTRYDTDGADGKPATPDRSRVGIEAMQTSTHNPLYADSETCKWGNTQLVLHECGWAAGTTTDVAQENGSVMDATNDAYFYQRKVRVWGDKPELYWGHVNRMRAHLGYPTHPGTPEQYR